MTIRPGLPPRPRLPPSPVRAPGGGGNVNRRPSQGPSAVRPVVPGSVPPGAPKPPPHTPFQPGAGPSPPLGLIFAVGVGVGFLVKTLWDLLNERPEEVDRELAQGEEIQVRPTNGPITIAATRTVVEEASTPCSPGMPFQTPGGTTTNEVTLSGFGTRVRKGAGGYSQNWVCSSEEGRDPNQTMTWLEILNAAGDVVARGVVSYTPTFRQPFRRNGQTVTFAPESVDTGEGPIPFPRITQPGEFAPGMEPKPPAREEEPQLQPQPLPVVPAPARIPTAVPGGAVAPAPVPVPGGLTGGQAFVPPFPGPVGSGVRSFRRATPGSGSQPITASGSRLLPPPTRQPTATGTTFLPNGRPLAPNGPPPTMQGIATEVGKLEQKLEIMLNPKEELSPLELLNKVIDQIENIEFLIERLFPPEPYTFPAGAYQLAPVCDRDSEGVLIQPLAAPWAAGEGELLELRRKLDALAQLIQHHKNLKQPTCGGRGSGPGSNVTVHFESP